jgi:hypothetical protein
MREIAIYRKRGEQDLGKENERDAVLRMRGDKPAPTAVFERS